MQEADDSLAEVKATVELVSPLVVKIGSAQVKAGDESLEKNLKAVSDVLESLWEHIDSYVKKGDFSKYVAGNTSRPTLTRDLHCIGSYKGKYQFLNGTVAFLRSWGVALKADEVQKLYASRNIRYY